MLLVTPTNTKYYAEEISACLLHRVNLDNVIIWKSILPNSEESDWERSIKSAFDAQLNEVMRLKKWQ